MAVSATYVGASGGLCARLVLKICAFTYHRALATSTSTQTVVRRRAAPSRVWRTLGESYADLALVLGASGVFFRTETPRGEIYPTATPDARPLET